MLQDWNGALTVLVRKRVNRHVERCRACSGRRRREVSPAMLLGIAPIAALPLMAGGLRAASVIRCCGSPPGTPPPPWLIGPRWRRHRTRSAIMVFPSPSHQPGSPWLHPLQPTPGAVAGTAAAVAAGITWIAVPLHHGVRRPGPPRRA